MVSPQAQHKVALAGESHSEVPATMNGPCEAALSNGSSAFKACCHEVNTFNGSNSKEEHLKTVEVARTSTASTECASPISTSPSKLAASNLLSTTPPPGKTSEEMASVGPRRPRAPRREVDLSCLLNAEQKDELVVLVNRSLDVMQRQVSKVFDYTNADTQAAALRKPWHVLFPKTLQDNSLGLGRREVRPSRAETEVAKETHEPQLPELKKEALITYRKWQSTVQKRVGEIVVKSTLAKPGQLYANIASNPKVGNSRQSRNVADGLRKKEATTTFAQADAAVVQLFPPLATPLAQLPMEIRILLLHALLLLLVSVETYNPNSRVLMLYLTSSLGVPAHILAGDEARLASGLFRLVKDIPVEDLVRKKGEDGRNSRRGRSTAGGAGTATFTSASALPVSLIDAEIGRTPGGTVLPWSVIASLLGPVIESNIPVGALFGIYGNRTTERIMEQCIRDIENFAFLPVHGASRTEYRDANDIAPDDRKLRVTLCINGWLGHEEEAVSPWRALGNRTEVFALGWEVDVLRKVRTSLETVLSSATWASTKLEILAWVSGEKRKNPGSNRLAKSGPVMAALEQGSWPSGLTKLSKIIDNPWSICMVRADKAGVLLADVIINKVQGERGVTLIGYSMGARVIYACLMTLAERRQFGLVDSVVMMGVPAPSQSRIWSIMRSVVAGRMVNVYSENDYLLGFLYRTGSIQYGVAGLQAIDGGFGVENIDVSDMISSHLRYQYLASSILKHMSWEDVDVDQVAKDIGMLSRMDRPASQVAEFSGPAQSRGHGAHRWRDARMTACPN